MKKLSFALFDAIRKDLEKHEAKVTLNAKIMMNDTIDINIQATFPDGTIWIIEEINRGD